MIIECGFLNKSSGYFYYVQNVIISKSGWTKIIVKYNNNILVEYSNSNSNIEYRFELTSDNNYNILLKVNDKEIMRQKQLFKVELDILDDNINFSYKLEEGLIVDH